MTLKAIYSLVLVAISLLPLSLSAQYRKPVNQPFADQKLYHLGFSIGFTGHDMILSHTGYTGDNGEVWFAEIPSYSVGFNVGLIGDRYLNEYFNLRLAPTLYLGERRFVFKEQASDEEYTASLKSNYVRVPLLLKFSAPRMKNYRPYFVAGGYAAMDIGTKKDDVLRFKKMDYGIELGIGCNIYLPLFKLCPELKFSFGLTDLVEKDRADITDKDLLKYTQALSSGKSRMISLVFNFE
ncbi:porin family protein [Dysgonomonas sp. 511]|uniref:type IX secretion/gliding motility protein PorT/SprT n=1 Tax=Dysgonomonas sp. 511 TaxID=2302930 RepID=UPI0013D2867C|nr:porin family protein [Dysgonomonas sp. 511]NDV78537.1 PorT family protein [Dysgonomonas sp. 511]